MNDNLIAGDLAYIAYVKDLVSTILQLARQQA